ncbi:MAG: hypothetical protein H6865_03255 [Rhodospirillales bacterium]|nr:hypothetical protein [Alphaproteobacteria bacterium]MCB9986636.1 hypothetical protein [Rhodospirillales bacterium]USO06835.1 MAG: hypothetical protein H6866_05130 [Rhodospirillales bacterium]
MQTAQRAFTEEAGLLKPLPAGFYGCVRDGAGFSVLFTTNDLARPVVMVTLDALRACLKVEGGRVGIERASPLRRTLVRGGVEDSEILKAAGKLAESAGCYQRTGMLGGAFDSLDAWHESFKRRHKKTAPAPVRLGPAQHRTTFVALKQQDDAWQRSFGGARRVYRR